MSAPLDTPQFALLRGCITAAAAMCGTREHGPMRLRGHFRRCWQHNGMHGSPSAPLQGRLCRWHQANSFGDRERKVREADKFRDRPTLRPTSGPSESGHRPRQREFQVDTASRLTVKCGKGERRKNLTIPTHRFSLPNQRLSQRSLIDIAW